MCVVTIKVMEESAVQWCNRVHCSDATECTAVMQPSALQWCNRVHCSRATECNAVMHLVQCKARP